METVSLDLGPRAGTGKKLAKRIRREGRVPGVVYGLKNEALPVSVDERTLSRILHSARHGHVMLDLNLPGGKEPVKAIFREIQRDPVRLAYLHCDFQRISLEEKLHVQVPVRVEGIADGVKNYGGILDYHVREIDIRCLPTEIPNEIVVDVTPLKIGGSIRVKDISLPGVEILLDAERAIVTIVAPSILKEAVPAAEGAEAAAEEPTEPELIKKKKGEEEEESKPEKGEKAEKAEAKPKGEAKPKK
jgi:large subunit ribosomal protein L25